MAVSYAVAGTATAGTDYTTPAGSLTIATGVATGAISIQTLTDSVQDPGETLQVSLSGAASSGRTVTVDATARAETQIVESGTVTVDVAAPAASVTEGGTAVFEVTLSDSAASPVGVTWATADGTAEAGSDYTAASGTLTFAPGGALSQTVTVATAEDDLDEPDETFEVQLAATLLPAGVTLGTSRATLTITDGDSGGTAVSLSLRPDRVAENAGAATVTVTASLGGAPRASDTTVVVRVAGGTATPGEDYAAIEGFEIPITSGQTSGTAQFAFEPLDDTLKEGSETVVLSGTAQGLAAGSATLRITDDDRSATERKKRPPSITLWTDELGYAADDEIRLYLDIDPRGDEREYTVFFYRESIETSERHYLAPRRRSTVLRDEVVDQRGRVEGMWEAGRLGRVDKELIWEGQVPYPGLWHFVAELRSPGTTQVLKRAYAKFVVAGGGFRVLNRRGFERAIDSDMTLTNDSVYFLGGRLLVKSGATLSIEAGTLIQAWGPAAEIVVEPGARIMAQGRREAPVVMTCSLPVGERAPGCWGGLRVLGRAPADSGPGLEEGAQPDRGIDYARDDPRDSSGELRYLRVEFAGGGSPPEAPSAALGFHGVGDGTFIDHVQVHASLGDGFVFRGGTAHCGYCVASDARRDSVAWGLGWKGSAQNLYVQQGSEAASAIRGSAEGPALDGGMPVLYNATLVGGYNIGVPGGSRGSSRSIGPGIVLEGEAAITAGNVLATGFGGFAIDGSVASFASGRSSFSHSILTRTGYRHSSSLQVHGRFAPYAEFTSRDPDLLNVRYEANPDPRPRSGSPALRLGNAAVPPFNDKFSRSTHYVGAFGKKNWLEEWTFFGAEQDYEVPVD